MDERLYRSRTDRVLSGVAGGLAARLNVDPSLVRVIWVILAIASNGVFLLIYIVMALVVPEEPFGPVTTAHLTPGDPAAPAAAPGSGPTPAPRSRERDPAVALVGGIVLILVGAFFLVRQYVPAFDAALTWPVNGEAAGDGKVGLARLRRRGAG